MPVAAAGDSLFPLLDLAFIRAQFPALKTHWALMDNAGGSAPCKQVIERVRAHMERLPVQLGASYGLSVEAGQALAAGREAAARLVNAEQDEVVLGASSTVLTQQLATLLRSSWREGDEVVVTNLDHEANVGPWRRLEETGIRVREWRVRKDTLTLEPADLQPLLNERTRLVAFTHCSNVVGSIVDVPAVTALARAAGVLTCVDGVAFAPHRRVDVQELGVDFYLASLYKVYGPHLALMFGRKELLLQAKSPNHFFVPADSVPTKLEPGNVNYELGASLLGILDYMQAFGAHHGLGEELDLEGCFARIAEHEQQLVSPLLAFLAGHPRVRLVGSSSPDNTLRVPTVSFTVEGRRAGEIPPLLDERSLAVRFGHFYAYRLIRDLGLLELDGVVRVSLAHYNAPQEVARLVTALDELLVI
jgi:cysteine desulfurase family protein (TIGR01976 family)